MGKDTGITEYFQDNERFADFFNGYVFQGKPVIFPEHLESQEIRGILKGNTDRYMYRDILKKRYQGTELMLLGIENQTAVHYAMPVRSFVYDGISYQEQLDRIRKGHQKRRDLTGEEYLSGFGRKDKLIPVITAVIYFGKKPWDGAKDLFGMFQMDSIPKEMLPYLNNYQINLFRVRQDKADCFRTDIRQCFQFLQKDGDRKALKSLLEQDESYRFLSEETFKMISCLSGQSMLLSEKKKYETKEGGYDMCKAFADMKLEGIMEGKLEGKLEGIKAFAKRLLLSGVSMEIIIQAIMEENQLTRQEAEKYIQ